MGIGPKAIREPLRADKLYSTAISQNVATAVTATYSLLNKQLRICTDVSIGNLSRRPPSSYGIFSELQAELILSLQLKTQSV